jgi:hypothetical protein
MSTAAAAISFIITTADEPMGWRNGLEMRGIEALSGFRKCTPLAWRHWVVETPLCGELHARTVTCSFGNGEMKAAVSLFIVLNPRVWLFLERPCSPYVAWLAGHYQNLPI